MYKWTAFPFVRLAICLMTGIILHQHFAVLWENWWISLIIGVVTFFLIHLTTKSTSILSGAFLLIIVVFIGGCLTNLHDQSNRPSHYSHFPKVLGFSGVIDSDFTERPKFYRYDFELYQATTDSGTFPVTGKIYLYIRKDSVSNLKIEYGDELGVKGSYFEIATPKNPHEFNYQEYLKLQNVYAHAFVGEDQLSIFGNKPSNPFWSLAYEIRNESRYIIHNLIHSEREKAILTALLIGVKDYLDDEVQKSYSAAGAMHVLAVSGLHVGIIYSLLLFVFKRWKELKAGKIAFVCTSIFVIWIYALVTGFSPSVMRAVTMFTIIIISGAFRRKANIYNTLGLSAIVLMLYDPYMIYSVGFQLSFIAVLGIVIFQPRLERIFSFRWKIFNYLWSITCVSIAAQLATFPLTLYYFHQFPTYFLVSNLIVIPAAVVMLVGGVVMLILGFLLPSVATWFGIGLEYFTCIINDAIALIQYLPFPIFDWLYFDVWETIFVYVTILFVTIGLMTYSFRRLAVGLISLVLLFGWGNVKAYQRSKERKIVFYELEGKIALDLIENGRAKLLLDDNEFGEVEAFQIDPNRIASGLEPAAEGKDQIGQSSIVLHHDYWDLIEWQNLRIAIIRADKDWKFSEPINADIVYFKYPGDYNEKSFKSEIVILGADFHKFDISRIRNSLSNYQIRIHSLRADGYFELDLTRKNQLSHK